MKENKKNKKQAKKANKIAKKEATISTTTETNTEVVNNKKTIKALKKDKDLINEAKSFKKQLTDMLDKVKSGKKIKNSTFSNIDDMAACIKVCKLIKKGDFVGASDKINKMNAFCMDMMPTTITNKLGTNTRAIHE